MTMRRLALFAVSGCSLVLSACGGGSDTSSSTPTPTPAPLPVTPPPTSTNDWQVGVFADSTVFAARCESPRTGIDPFNNLPFPDQQGSAFEEKMWMRSWTYETYLWFDEVPDNNPEDFTVPAYFDQLVTPALTPSGRPRDNFHFSENTEQYNTRTQSAVTSGYGISWQFESLSAPRSLIVRYTEPGSGAANANIPRGASLIGVDNVDFVNANTQAEIDVLNAALFPSQPGSAHEFIFATVDGTEQSVLLTSENVTVVPVQNVRVLDTDVGQVGYMQFNTFITPAQPDLISAFEQFTTAGISELVIDLRYNGGGSLALASQIAYMIAGPSQTNNRDFEVLLNNGKIGPSQDIAFYDREIDYDASVFLNNPLPSPELTRVFVLSTPGTCSASESVINGLRGIDVEVVLIGDVTCGKPFGFFPEDNCGTTYFTIQFQSTNDKGFGAYQDGFRPVASPVFDDELPGCFVADDLSQPLGSESEAMFAAALQYMVDGTCPVIQANDERGSALLDTMDDNTRAAGFNFQRRDVILNAIANEKRETINEH